MSFLRTLKHFQKYCTLALLAGALCACPTSSRADLWVTAFFPGFSSATLPPADLDFSAVTHIVHFALWPNGDGSLIETNGITPEGIADIVSATHAANKKVL